MDKIPQTVHTSNLNYEWYSGIAEIRDSTNNVTDGAGVINYRFHFLESLSN